nr:MAG TPA: hypothetical protein [Caudoviricetes sp.]
MFILFCQNKYKFKKIFHIKSKKNLTIYTLWYIITI